jgi:hypothetical protein
MQKIVIVQSYVDSDGNTQIIQQASMTGNYDNEALLKTKDGNYSVVLKPYNQDSTVEIQFYKDKDGDGKFSYAKKLAGDYTTEVGFRSQTVFIYF